MKESAFREFHCTSKWWAKVYKVRLRHAISVVFDLRSVTRLQSECHSSELKTFLMVRFDFIFLCKHGFTWTLKSSL